MNIDRYMIDIFIHVNSMALCVCLLFMNQSPPLAQAEASYKD